MRCSVVLRCVLLETARFFFARREKCRRKPSHHRVRVAHPSCLSSILDLWRDLCFAVRHIAVRRTVWTRSKGEFGHRVSAIGSKGNDARVAIGAANPSVGQRGAGLGGGGTGARSHLVCLLWTGASWAGARRKRAREPAVNTIRPQFVQRTLDTIRPHSKGGRGRKGNGVKVTLRGEKPVTSRNPIFCPGPEKSS